MSISTPANISDTRTHTLLEQILIDGRNGKNNRMMAVAG